jgi:hypothetical protein
VAKGNSDTINLVALIKESLMLKKYCAWHPKYFGKELFMGVIPSERDDTTHGLCDDCRKLLEKEIEVMKEKNLLTAKRKEFGICQN